MPRKCPYKIDLNVKEGHEGYNLITKCQPPVGMKSLIDCERSQQALGPKSTSATFSQSQKNALAAKQQKMAMALAMKPGQQIMMNAFMMYMSGSQLNIFSISITSMAILSPLTSIFSMEQTFGQLQKVDIQMPKLLFLALNLAWLGLGLYKMSSMRLLPTTSADWTSKIQWKELMEMTSIPPDNMIL